MDPRKSFEFLPDRWFVDLPDSEIRLAGNRDSFIADAQTEYKRVLHGLGAERGDAAAAAFIQANLESRRRFCEQQIENLRLAPVSNAEPFQPEKRILMKFCREGEWVDVSDLSQEAISACIDVKAHRIVRADGRLSVIYK
jgi:predicted transcriptional regulator